MPLQVSSLPAEAKCTTRRKEIHSPTYLRHRVAHQQNDISGFKAACCPWHLHMVSFGGQARQGRPLRIFAWFRAAQGILVLGLLVSILVQNTQFSTLSSFAPSTWASLALGLAAMLYLIASLVINILWGGFHFIFYYTSLNKPVLFNVLGVLMDLCFAGAFAVVLYAQTSVDEGFAGFWSLHTIGFDCLGFADFIVANINPEPDQVVDRSLLVRRCQTLIATFACVVINWYGAPSCHTRSIGSH